MNGDQGAYQDLPVTRFLSQCTRWEWDLNLGLVTSGADLRKVSPPPRGYETPAQGLRDLGQAFLPQCPW